MRTISRKSMAREAGSCDGAPFATASTAVEDWLELGRDIDTDLVLVVAEERNVAFPLNIFVPERHRIG